MIDYINTELNRWAVWCASGRSNLGYPRAAPFTNLTGGGGRQAVINDDDAMDIERAVRQLRQIAPEQYKVVELMYLKMSHCPAGVIARELHCSRDTVYARLHSAHLNIMNALFDQDINRAPKWRAQLNGGTDWKV